MITNINGIKVLLPELTLVIFSVISLLVGVCSKKNALMISNYICMAGLLISLALNNSQYPLVGSYFNSSYAITGLSILFKNILIICSFIGLLLLHDLQRFEKLMHFEISVLMTISTIGMLTLQCSQSFLTFYLSLELLTLPLYIMAAININNSKSSEAGLKYFILGSLSSCLLLFGISLIYASVLHINQITLPPLSFNLIIYLYEQLITNKLLLTSQNLIFSPLTLEVGLLFIMAGTCFKMAAAPFHMWVIDVYEGSPTIVTNFLSTAPKIAVVLFFVKFYYLILAPTLVINFSVVLTCIFTISIFIGSFTAINQTNIKRMLAYGSIGHIGFGMIGIPIYLYSGKLNYTDTANIIPSITSCIMYFIIYASTTLTFFACILALRKNGKEIETLKDLTMLSNCEPKIAFIMSVMLFSMAGIPPFAGFFAKLGIIEIIILSNSYGISMLYIVGSIIATFYYLNLIKIMYIEQSNNIVTYKGTAITSTIITIGTIFNIFFILFWSSFELFINNSITNMAG